MLGPHVVGVRIVVRRLLPGETGPSGGPAMTDLLGVCEEWTDLDLAVRGEDGTLTRIPLADVVSGKPVPPRPSVSLRTPAARIHRHALTMWPHLHTEPLGEWVLRADPAEHARRANSALAIGDPRLPLADAVADVAAWYDARGAAPIACVEVGSAAEAGFVAAGWGPQRPGEGDTLVQVASVPRALRSLRDLAPGSGPELDATVEEEGPRVAVRLPGAVGRAALDGDWLGLHAIATDPDLRRRRLGAAVVRALLDWGAERGARTAYLQVWATNTPALGLYDRIGFVTHHAYRYLVPPR